MVQYYDPSEIVVGGTITATGTTFAPSGSTAATANFQVNTGSTLQSGSVTGNIFNLPISVPVADVPLLATNLSFQNVAIDAGTLSSGTVTINLIGTATTANLLYVFPGNFTVQTGATLNFGPNVPVRVQPGVIITDSGTLGFSFGDTVTLAEDISGILGPVYDPSEIVVGGTLTAAGTTFARAGTGVTTAAIQVNSGGHFHRFRRFLRRGRLGLQLGVQRHAPIRELGDAAYG